MTKKHDHTRWRSGFCNTGNPPESHRRCLESYDGHPCICRCHSPAGQILLLALLDPDRALTRIQELLENEELLREALETLEAMSSSSVAAAAPSHRAAL